MWHPEVMDSEVTDRNEVVLRSVDLCLIHCKADHCHPFACSEGIVERMTELRTSNSDYDFGDSIQSILNAMHMTHVKRLESTDQQTPTFVAVQAQTPFPSCYAAFSLYRSLYFGSQLGVWVHKTLVWEPIHS